MVPVNFDFFHYKNSQSNTSSFTLPEFGYKMCNIGVKWANIVTLKDKISVRFGSKSQSVLKSDL